MKVSESETEFKMEDGDDDSTDSEEDMENDMENGKLRTRFRIRFGLDVLDAIFLLHVFKYHYSILSVFFLKVLNKDITADI